MKKPIRLTETELTKIVNRVLNEQEMENPLYDDIMSVIRNSNASHEETIEILRSIINEMKSSRRVRRNAESRFRDFK